MCRYEEPRQDSDPLWWVKPHPGATADILVVDDVRMNRMMTIFVAKKLGLSFNQATDGEKALDLLRRNTYSMVFMDRQMPGMNGDVATEQARANGYTLPIVMVSGDTFEPQERAELKRRGMTAFLSKMSVPGTRHAMKKLQSMKKAQISQPEIFNMLDNSRAYRIIYLMDKLDFHVANINTDYDRIKSAALAQKQKKEVKKWINSHLSGTYIKLPQSYKKCSELSVWFKSETKPIIKK